MEGSDVESGDDTKIVLAAFQCSEQVGIRRIASIDDRSIPKDDLHESR